MMKDYEYTYLTRQDMTEEAAKNLLDKLVASITAKNGVVVNLPKAYKKRLAYRIKKQDAAYVNTILFQMEPAPLDEFKKETALIVEILRGLVISYDPEKLKREIRPEMGDEESKSAETVSATEKPAAETAKVEPVKIAKEEEKPEIKEEKEEKKETKKEEPVTEAPKEEKKEEEKPASAQGYGEAKPAAAESSGETKPAKPRKRKIKAELRDIGEKLDEILK